MTTPIVAKSIRVDDIDIGDVEEGASHPLLLVQGSGATDLRTWRPQIAPSAEHYRVIARSQRYHRSNAWSGDGTIIYATSRHAADLAGLIRWLYRDRADYRPGAAPDRGRQPRHLRSGGRGTDAVDALLEWAVIPGTVHLLYGLNPAPDNATVLAFLANHGSVRS